MSKLIRLGEEFVVVAEDDVPEIDTEAVTPDFELVVDADTVEIKPYPIIQWTSERAAAKGVNLIRGKANDYRATLKSLGIEAHEIEDFLEAAGITEEDCGLFFTKEDLWKVW